VKIRTLLPSLGLAAALLALPTASLAGDCGAGGAVQPAHESKDIVATAAAAGTFETLLAAANAAGLAETLQGPGPFTVFAPTDEAFAKLPAGTVDRLLEDPTALADILTYHVVRGKVPAAEAQKLDWAETVQGQSLRLTKDAGSLRVDGAKVVASDVMASNGVIHVIDAVVLPRKDIVDTAIAAGSFQTLVEAAKAAGLVETLKGKGPFTVFAPADAAFAALPAGAVEGLLEDRPALRGLLLLHVVPGRVLSTDLRVGRTEVATAGGRKLVVEKARDGSVTIDGAKVVTADVLAGNGVVHVIDAVVMPRQP